MSLAKDKMNITNSSNLKVFNECENTTEIIIDLTSKKSNVKLILSDVRENLYLILVSLIPLIFYPILYLLKDKNINVAVEIFSNPDLMLLPIPYILHCMLLITVRGVSRWKKPVIGWYFILEILSMLFYFVLKLNIIETLTACIIIIWLFMIIAVISGVLGSVLTLGKENE
ncbi:MAG: hypothetical protein HFE40_02010 [Clostridia bacterium]|nr:hypothetical protein [Clostridia bacterium]